MIRGTKGDLVKLLILMKLIILDICLSIKPNHAINEVTIKQTFVDFQSRFFIRICNNGTWTDWKQIQTT